MTPKKPKPKVRLVHYGTGGKAIPAPAYQVELRRREGVRLYEDGSFGSERGASKTGKPSAKVAGGPKRHVSASGGKSRKPPSLATRASSELSKSLRASKNIGEALFIAPARAADRVLHPPQVSVTHRKPPPKAPTRGGSTRRRAS